MQSRAIWGRQLLMMILAGGIVMGHGAVAWAGFFDACIPGDATITVNQNTTVKNERVILPGDDFHTCEISVVDGVTLEFKNVRVTATGDTQLIFEGGDSSRLIIRQSRLKACDLDTFGFDLVKIVHSELKEPVGAGCDNMELENIGDLEIVSSTLRSDSLIELRPDDNVTIEKSTLKAEEGIFIGTGFGASSMHTLVKKTNMIANENIEIDAQQDTTVIKNKFNAGGTITITGDPCTSKSNRPNVLCQ